MLYLLLPILFIGVYLAIYSLRKGRLERIRKRLNTRNHRKKNRAVLSWRQASASQRLIGFSTVLTSLLGLFVCLVYFDTSPMIGFILGSVIPSFIGSVWKEYKMDKYEEDMEKAIEYAFGVFSAGQTVERWILEVPDQLDGPLKEVFRNGAMQIKQNLAAVDFLESLAKDTPSPYFSYVIDGLISNMEAGDLESFTDETLDELQHLQKYARVMRQIRKENTMQLVAMTGFPLILYTQFSEQLNALLEGSVKYNLLFGTCIIGYIVIMWFARRSANTTRLA